MDFPGGSDGKVSVYNEVDLGSIPGSGRIPGEGNGNPLQYSCLENPLDGGDWCPWVHKESDTTEQLHFHFQWSWSPSAFACLENSVSPSLLKDNFARYSFFPLTFAPFLYLLSFSLMERAHVIGPWISSTTARTKGKVFGWKKPQSRTHAQLIGESHLLCENTLSRPVKTQIVGCLIYVQNQHREWRKLKKQENVPNKKIT